MTGVYCASDVPGQSADCVLLYAGRKVWCSFKLSRSSARRRELGDSKLNDRRKEMLFWSVHRPSTAVAFT